MSSMKGPERISRRQALEAYAAIQVSKNHRQLVIGDQYKFATLRRWIYAFPEEIETFGHMPRS